MVVEESWSLIIRLYTSDRVALHKDLADTKPSLTASWNRQHKLGGGQDMYNTINAGQTPLERPDAEPKADYGRIRCFSFL